MNKGISYTTLLHSLLMFSSLNTCKFLLYGPVKTGTFAYINIIDSVIRALKTTVITLFCLCFQYLSCSVNAKGVAFTTAPQCSTSNNLTNPIIVRSHLACASQCCQRPERFAYTFSQQASTCSMYLSDGTASISTNGGAFTSETETYCKGMYRVTFV